MLFTFFSKGVRLEISVVRIFSVIIVTTLRTKSLCCVRRMFMVIFIILRRNSYHLPKRR